MGATDQHLGKPQPPEEKGLSEEDCPLTLPAVETMNLQTRPLVNVLKERRSHRSFTQKPLGKEELAFLLWATQGVTGQASMLRAVPSAGARHPFETYVYLFRSQEVPEGLYRYSPLQHSILPIAAKHDFSQLLSEACFGQSFVKEGAAVFIWTAIPYRMEWRYGAASPKLIALDSGHVCQNLYIAAEALGLGTCAIAAYDQKKMDQLLEVDGDEEFVLYLAPVGSLEHRD